MLESLKKKTLLGNLWCIIVLGIVTAALGVVFGPGIVKMLAGPAYFEPLDDHEDILSLQGQYITMDVDTLIDYYAETVSSESGKRDEVSAREYIMPINTPDATIYIGLEVPASKIDDAEAVVDDTARMLDDEDGSYEWDGSYVTVRGTLKRMDDETKQLWEDYFIDAGFSYDDIGLEDGCTFLPLVLTDDEIDGSDTFVLGFMGIVMLLVLALLIWFVVRSLTGGFQKQIRRYIAATADPEGTEQALDRFYEDTMQEGKVRMSRSWLMYDKGGNSWVLAGDDVVWAYQYTVRHKAYGILTVNKELMVRVFGAKEKRACHDIYVRNEDEAQEILQQMARTYPDALIGYDQDIERKYHANPAAFHQAVITARHAPAAPAQPAEAQAGVTSRCIPKVKIARWHLMPSGNFWAKFTSALFFRLSPQTQSSCCRSPRSGRARPCRRLWRQHPGQRPAPQKKRSACGGGHRCAVRSPYRAAPT